MPKGLLEHVNISVTDPDRSAALLERLCGWKERWRGPSMLGGRTIHVGTERQYVALYTGDQVKGDFAKGAPLNHVALEVDDLAAAEGVVNEAGLEPFGYGDYEPGERFYFFDWDGIEWEVVSYE
ncbi:MAG: glyoxalase [Sphingomonadales bacterium CG12_big_fil_rev_8_21_14_0_65_65_10]|nr:MAG: glyoxalase [Sphingomonadales bacterium CG12_big_fil_rev_8_21_14_0_65_65_10]